MPGDVVQWVARPVNAYQAAAVGYTDAGWTTRLHSLPPPALWNRTYDGGVTNSLPGSGHARRASIGQDFGLRSFGGRMQEAQDAQAIPPLHIGRQGPITLEEGTIAIYMIIEAWEGRFRDHASVTIGPMPMYAFRKLLGEGVDCSEHAVRLTMRWIGEHGNLVAMDLPSADSVDVVDLFKGFLPGGINRPEGVYGNGQLLVRFR